MLLRLFAKLRFLWSSTNQHGVHSPFVFNYLTQCLYKKASISNEKEVNVLLKSIPYFKVKSCYIAPDTILNEIVRDHYPDLEFNSPPYDLVYMNIREWEEFYQQDTHLIHNDTALLLTGIHKNSHANKLWNMLIGTQQFNVSIDCYHCGVLFKRKEQRKEHFKVRI